MGPVSQSFCHCLLAALIRDLGFGRCPMHIHKTIPRTNQCQSYDTITWAWDLQLQFFQPLTSRSCSLKQFENYTTSAKNKIKQATEKQPILDGAVPSKNPSISALLEVSPAARSHGFAAPWTPDFPLQVPHMSQHIGASKVQVAIIFSSNVVTNNGRTTSFTA